MNGIEINEEVFNAAARKEYEIASRETASKGYQYSLRQTRKRLDEISAEILSSSPQKLACGPGCWYCCFYKVDARANEIFQIIEYVRSHFKPDTAQLVREKIDVNAKIMRGFSHQEKLSANLQCPFLEDGKCSIYPVRPEKCRTFHAQDMEGCKRSYEEPDNLSIPNSYITDLFSAINGQCDGYKMAMYESGYDVSVYELNMALSVSMRNSKPRKHYERKKRAFSATISDE